MHIRSRRRRAAAATLTTALLCAGLQAIAAAPPAAAATTIHVPADQPTITAAIAAAVDGDTIEVAPGTYHENVDLGAKALTLLSSGGPGVTTIDADGGTVVTLASGLVEGFTITGGDSARGSAVIGSGTFTLRGNRIVDNSTLDFVFARIVAVDGPGTVEGNYFANNSCITDSGHSGVISVQPGYPVTAVNNVIVSNDCRAIRLDASGTGVKLTNNTIALNDAGIVFSQWAEEDAMVSNNLITANTMGVVHSVVLPSSFHHNFVGENTQDHNGPGSISGSGNLTGDPLLVDTAGRDLRLTAASPAVDAGSAADGPPPVDFDGSTRPLDGPDADLDAEPDIGAYEWDGSEPPPVRQTGVLDKGWSGDGFQNQSSRFAIALAPTSDGGTFTGVYRASDGNGPMRISKYTSTGAPAAGWGSAGYVLRAFEPGGNGVSYPTQVVPSGSKVTVVGEHYRSTARLGVARLLSNGSYDSTFSSDGRALYKVFPGEHDVVSSFRTDVLSGGKIGIAAIAFDYDSRGNLVFTAQAMLRLNDSGSLDTTFSGDGVAVVPLSWSDIRWRPNGSSFVGVQGSTTHQVRKLLPNGQLDKAFSGDGVASAACGTHRGATMEVDPSGRPVLMCVKPGGTSITLAMYRFTTTGGFDTSYSGDGKTLWVIPNANGSTDDAMHGFDASAKPWAMAGGPGTTTSLRIYTLSSSGNPDTAFNSDGAATITLPFNVDLNTFARAATGRLFIANFNGDVNVSMIAVKV